MDKRGKFSCTGTRLLAAERVVLAAAAITGLLYILLGQSLRQPWELYLRRLEGSVAWYVTGLAICFFLVRVKQIQKLKEKGARLPLRETWTGYYQQYLVAWKLVDDLRLVHVLSLSFVVFLNLKNLIPLINQRVWDGAFISFDNFVCGDACGLLLIRLFGSGKALALSDVYLSFYPYLGLLLSLMVLQRNRRLAHEFSICFMLLWLCSLVVVGILPTWGPCFSFPTLFSALPATEVSYLQQELWAMKVELLKDPNAPNAMFLISGFPSLHLAVPILGTLYLREISRPLSLLSLAFALITFVTTLYFGWHFLLDNLGAVILAFVFYSLRKKLFRQSERETSFSREAVA